MIFTQVFHYAVESLHPAPIDSCSLFMNHSSIVALPLKISRNNTPSRAHALTKAVKNATSNSDEYIVVSLILSKENSVWDMILASFVLN